MGKEPQQKKCEWCNDWFPTVRDGRFCCDRHRVRWHRQSKLDRDMKVYLALRKALEYCIKQHPELRSGVNDVLSKAKVAPAGLEALAD